MNKIHFSYRLVIVLLSVFLFASCSVEPIDPVLASQIAQQQADDNNNNGGGSTTSGDYFPMALNNVWNYSFFNSTVIKDYRINAIETFNNINYYRLNRAITQPMDNPLITDSDVVVHLRKENGNYYQRTAINKTGTSTSPGIVVEPFELIFMKDYLNVGESFTQNINMSVTTSFMGTNITNTQPVTYIITLLEKNVNYVVGSTSYSDVIKIKIDYGDGYSYNWFSRNVGWIKSQDFDTNGTQNNGQNLESYTLF